MDNRMEQAFQDFNEWWFIFSTTGKICDYFPLAESLKNLDLLRSEEYDMEM